MSATKTTLTESLQHPVIQEMRHMLPPKAKTELMLRAFECPHQEGSRNGVRSVPFGKRTAISIGKGADSLTS